MARGTLIVPAGDCGYLMMGMSMRDKQLLPVAASINMLVGIVLLAFRPGLAAALGLPSSAPTFYPNLLGAVLLGIGAALLVESLRRPTGPVGLGRGGAVAINMCAGIVLGLRLLSTRPDLPTGGQLLLWSLVVVAVAISFAECRAWRRHF